jgi:phage shock protein PspC (stress-responsive transcriptional regulator)
MNGQTVVETSLPGRHPEDIEKTSGAAARTKIREARRNRDDMGDQRLRACPYCAELIKEEAIKCFHCKSVLDTKAYLAHQGTWHRVREGRTLAGVCAGLSRATGLPVLTLRLAFILLTLLGGHGVALYIILYLLMPTEPALCRSDLSPTAV